MKKTGSLKKKSVEAINRFLSDQMNKKADVFLTAQQTVNIGLADSVFNYNWESLTDYTPIELERG
jgi:ATP-dependent protease ClpP protease subunit